MKRGYAAFFACPGERYNSRLEFWPNGLCRPRFISAGRIKFLGMAGFVASVENVNKNIYLGENIRYFPDCGGSKHGKSTENGTGCRIDQNYG